MAFYPTNIVSSGGSAPIPSGYYICNNSGSQLTIGQFQNNVEVTTATYLAGIAIISVTQLRNFYATVYVSSSVAYSLSVYTLTNGVLTPCSLSNTLIESCDYIIACMGNNNQSGKIKFTIKW